MSCNRSRAASCLSPQIGLREIRFQVEVHDMLLSRGFGVQITQFMTVGAQRMCTYVGVRFGEQKLWFAVEVVDFSRGIEHHFKSAGNAWFRLHQMLDLRQIQIAAFHVQLDGPAGA